MFAGRTKFISFEYKFKCIIKTHNISFPEAVVHSICAARQIWLLLQTLMMNLVTDTVHELVYTMYMYTFLPCISSREYN